MTRIDMLFDKIFPLFNRLWFDEDLFHRYMKKSKFAKN